MIAPKKHLGQHFLTDIGTAERIARAILNVAGGADLVEVGPGKGVLTQFLLGRENHRTIAVELDKECIPYLQKHFTQPDLSVREADFLRLDLHTLTDAPIVICGNFPYNISTQIVFKAIENRDKVTALCGMFQKEVAERLCAPHGSKVYGITSVIAQAFFDTEYLFTVNENVFNPPPKVKSGVMHMVRKTGFELGCDEKEFIKVVKAAFNQRRKTLRNALKAIPNVDLSRVPEDILNKRAEQLPWPEFVNITRQIATL